eukprot:TRINITY_DN14943_c0_g1_i1.p1 TRINITY_DN14943_c0_g1~~TRINITY_DN14943_c0_g1_i1.p1  ORF type:complete len:237 (-),score=28.02 TRINITY_DN14943_c0_g1_i1:49-738(-)
MDVSTSPVRTFQLGQKKNQQQNRSFFGKELSLLHDNNTSSQLPYLLEQIFRVLNNKLDTESIILTRASPDRLRSLAEEADLTKLSITDLEFASPYETADLLLLFLREIPSSLFTREIPPELIEVQRDCQNDQQEWERRTKELLDKLPDINKRVLFKLLEFLRGLVALSDKNKVRPIDAARVLGPCLFFSTNMESAEVLFNHAADIHVFLERMIQSQHLFEFLADRYGQR